VLAKHVGDRIVRISQPVDRNSRSMSGKVGRNVDAGLGPVRFVPDRVDHGDMHLVGAHQYVE
jgi:hypothetical protein